MMAAADHGAQAQAPEEQLQARLREFDHRFRNDLQLLASMFVLQLRRTPAGPARDIVEDALARVNAIVAVHRRFDPDLDPDRLDAAALVRELAVETAAARPDVELRLDLAPVSLPGRQAAPFAVIASELMRNGFRHAYPAGPGALQVSLAAEDGRIRLTVCDAGVGLGSGAPPQRGFGVTLVELLARQLRGEFELADAGPGVSAQVRFPEAV
jgi:two-component sensor histidine kinase